MALLADPARRIVDARRMVAVLAHPDDETIALGAQLHRMAGLRLVIVTDGAPRDLVDAKAHGFTDAHSYTAARRNELTSALAASGAPGPALTLLDIPDQGAAHALPALVRRLQPLLDGAEVVFTHAFEGGHPDHDATAFAVKTAVDRLGEGAGPDIVEMPFYRLGENGEFLLQDFDPSPGAPPVRIFLRPDERERKERMVAAHVTQREMLAQFSLGSELFRKAPAYDFDRLPNNGRLWYEQFGWGVDGPAWLGLVSDARRELAGGAP
jgi:LmbE family N-acetylglucosaminyl deacetylase